MCYLTSDFVKEDLLTVFLTVFAGLQKESQGEWNELVKGVTLLGAVAHSFNPSVWEAEVGGPLGSRSA